MFFKGPLYKCTMAICGIWGNVHSRMSCTTRAQPEWYMTFESVHFPIYHNIAIVHLFCTIHSFWKTLLHELLVCTEQTTFPCAWHHQQWLQICYAALWYLVTPRTVTWVLWWKTTRMVHGAVKSGAAINGKLPQWYMISCTTPSYGTWENVPWPT